MEKDTKYLMRLGPRVSDEVLTLVHLGEMEVCVGVSQGQGVIGEGGQAKLWGWRSARM
jgi:hypothetical protein